MNVWLGLMGVPPNQGGVRLTGGKFNILGGNEAFFRGGGSIRKLMTFLTSSMFYNKKNTFMVNQSNKLLMLPP